MTQFIARSSLSLTCLLLSTLGSGLGTQASAAPASVVDVVGWPLPELSGATPALDIGDDPVYGRQICPPLTRLNLADKKSEELLLKKVVEEHGAQGPVWRYEYRQSLYWWDGTLATSRDLADFLRAQIPAIAKVRSGGLWQVPDFEVTTVGEQAVKVRFKQAPPFGPFVLNGVPFYRKAEPAKNAGIQFECVGLYKPQTKPFGLALVPTSGYKFRHVLPDIHLYKDGKHPESKRPMHFELRYANTVNSLPATRPPDVNFGCQHSLDLPNLLMLVWNNKSDLGKYPEFRRAVGALVPRGALVNAGAAALAEASSSPVPRQHPGFSAQTTIRPFDIRGASLALNKLGYRRKTGGAPRLDASGKPLHLLLLTQSKSQGLAEKVLIDALSAVGIAVDVKSELPQDEQADATLANFTVDWPRVSLLAEFHSGMEGGAPVMAQGDKILDRQLEQYAASLTTATPDFTLLGAIQRRLAELEPVTVLLQQKACIDSGTGFRLARGSISQRDPDWFRQLLF